MAADEHGPERLGYCCDQGHIFYIEGTQQQLGIRCSRQSLRHHNLRRAAGMLRKLRRCFQVNSHVQGPLGGTTLHNFTGGDGANPISNVVMDANGNLYGTTAYGGDTCQDRGCGVVRESRLSRTHWTVVGDSQ